jgi:hypothetical protein
LDSGCAVAMHHQSQEIILGFDLSNFISMGCKNYLYIP